MCPTIGRIVKDRPIVGVSWPGLAAVTGSDRVSVWTHALIAGHSRDDLDQKITDLVIRHNATALPYRWAYDAESKTRHTDSTAP